MKTSSRTLLTLGFLSALTAFVATVVPPAAAQELIIPPIKDRKYPQGVFCPLPIDVPFVANGPIATIRFSTNVFYLDSSDNSIHWSQQYLDNIAVATQAVFDANLVPRPSDDQVNSYNCYFDELVDHRFQFQNAGVLPFLDTFDTDPVLRAWDLSHGAYWDPTRTAPNDPGTDIDFTPTGALGLGQDSATPSLEDSAYTSVTVAGLVEGETYVLSGWWNVQDMLLDKIFLTIRIYGSDVVPITRRTWGEIKRQYR